MKTYKVICKTNAYQASRNAMFKKHSTVAEILGGLSLKEAYKELLSLYNDKFESERTYATNWGIAVIQSLPYLDGANITHKDGTRSFDYDGYRYEIITEGE